MSGISAVMKPATHQARDVDPIVLQIVEGTLSSIEAEIEYAIERTARSPMIREAHDYRVGLFDRHCRKLTGRSYSAMPNAVVRDFPPQTMKPGDVFLMNDTYLTEGSIGHLPDLCSTVPVFHGGEVVAYIQAFGHHDDIGGRVPGSMPGTAVTVFEEGIAIPPVKIYSEGVRNDAVFTIIRRNTRVPEMLSADLDSEIQACLMGARRMAGLMKDKFNIGFIDVGGWDTHVNQGSAQGALASNVDSLGKGLAALSQELGAEWRNTVVAVVSEFGRTFRENGNKGTDHGHGSVYWILGGSVNGGRIAGEQMRVERANLFQDRDYPVLNEYRAVLGGLFASLWGLSSDQLQRVFPASTPVNLNLV